MSKAEEWLFFAESDLKVADVILNEGIYNEVCFHAQQAVEKSFKAILDKNDQDIPKIHNLLPLLKKAEKYQPEIEQFLEACKFLTQFYTPTRYPDMLVGSLEESLPSKEEAERAVKYAGEIFNFVKEKIK